MEEKRQGEEGEEGEVMGGERDTMGEGSESRREDDGLLQ